MANIFNINNQAIKTTASITITDQTDVADLTGGLAVVKGGKNQIFLADNNASFSPDWSRNNLVLRPYLYASTIIRVKDGENYEPDLFDPNEYPSLSDTSADKNIYPYINTKFLDWYIRDMNGVETLIDPSIDNRFSFSYEVNGKDISDKRFLVIKDNIIEQNSSITVICRFNYYDPHARQYVKQSYEMDLFCLTTGRGANEIVINSVNGTTIRNGIPGYIDLYVSYFKDGVEADVQNELENSLTSSTLRWYLRGTDGSSWILLDGTKQNNTDYAYMDMFEVCRKNIIDNEEVIEETTNARGGYYLRLYPAIISGSSVLKAVLFDSGTNKEHAAVTVVYDTSDAIQSFIHSSNGDKIYQGVNALGTTLTCMINMHGSLLLSEDERYETDFEYYWFRISKDGTSTSNVYVNDNGKLEMVEMDDNENIELKSTSRSIQITPDDVDFMNTFQCVVVDKAAQQAEMARAALIESSPTEDDLVAAYILNEQLGIDGNDPDALLATAYEINSYNNSPE